MNTSYDMMIQKGGHGNLPCALTMEPNQLEQNKTVYVTLRPHYENGIVTQLQIRLVIDGEEYREGDVFDALPLSLASCNCTLYDADSFHASDNNGDVSMEFRQGMGHFGPQREYVFGRDTSGKLTIMYEASVAAFNPYKRNPGFSLAAHDHGVTGAGLTFLLLPKGQRKYHVEYDFSENAGGIGIAGRKKGAFGRVCTDEDFKNVYFALGNLQEYHSEGSQLHIYTLDEDNLFFDEFAHTVQIYYDYISRFFHDRSEGYSIILYPTKRTELTGTALMGICYMGLGNHMIQGVAEVENVLAHELTHNWCYVLGEERMSSLFTEGTAEYYSCYMQYHTGQVDLDGYVESVNEKLRGCYCHSLARTESYPEIYDKSWTHADCQRIPYVKGVLLFLQLDSLIRRRTGDAANLNDIILTVVDEANAGAPMTFDDFQRMVNDLTEGEAQQYIDAAIAPGLPLPDSDYFGPDYELVETTIPVTCEGFDPTVRYTDNIIRGLVPGSNAERAGLQNGDEILQIIADNGHPERPAEVTVRRGGETLHYSYLQQGEDVPCWQYKRKAY